MQKRLVRVISDPVRCTTGTALPDASRVSATRNGNTSTPSEALNAYQALKSVTLDAAWAMGLEGSIGSISIGKRANFTVLDKNPLNNEAKDWPAIKIWGVVLDDEKRALN